MLPTEPSDTSVRGESAITESATARADLLPHLKWELEEIMSRVRPDDLSAGEIDAILAILAPAHCRVIGRPARRPRRGLVAAGHQDSTPKLT